ncbi:MAG: hypothetical protein AAF629_23635, partial [Chloroflexota bacterium]
LGSLFDEATQDQLIIRDATVVIENSLGTSIQLDYDMDKKRYVAATVDFELEPGETYIVLNL